MPEDIIPSGFDRADGLDDRLGTADPEGYVSINGVAVDNANDIVIDLQELPDSPEIERAEQATIQHNFTTDWITGSEMIGWVGRGTIQQDSGGNITRVLASRLKHERGGKALLSITSEGLNFDSPPDEFSCMPVDLGINIMKHPRYLYALMPQPDDSVDTRSMKNTIVRVIQQYQEAPVEPSKASYLQQLTIDDSEDGVNEKYAKAAAQEIIQKMWLQEDQPYIAGLEIKWTQYFFVPPPITLGGYIEDPINHVNTFNPGLPDFFGAIDGGPYLDATRPIEGDPSIVEHYATNTIFAYIADTNPQCFMRPTEYGDDAFISWLRYADELEYQRTWFRLTRTWRGAPIGNWDPQTNSQYSRPTKANPLGGSNGYTLLPNGIVNVG